MCIGITDVRVFPEQILQVLKNENKNAMGKSLGLNLITHERLINLVLACLHALRSALPRRSLVKNCDCARSIDRGDDGSYTRKDDISIESIEEAEMESSHLGESQNGAWILIHQPPAKRRIGLDRIRSERRSTSISARDGNVVRTNERASGSNGSSAAEMIHT